MISLPHMALVRQTFDPEQISDIPAMVSQELNKIDLQHNISPGQTIAITVGSRGIADIDKVICAIVKYIKSVGATPFIFPAMGSHGGATANGQKQVLENIGVSESFMGCSIQSGMEVDKIGQTNDGVPVFADRHALAADHLIVVNRVKPHTKFEGTIESGLMKMMAIGVGKHKGAISCHQASIRLGMEHIIKTVGEVVLDELPVLCGIGLVENGYDQLAIIHTFLPENFVEEEQKLLIEARKKMARLPFDKIDLLIVDELGKNISGTGMDPNVTGVNKDILGSFCTKPDTRRLFVRDLTVETQGNALGIGLADFTTTRLVKKIDRQKTYINCLTGISPEKGAIPMYFDSDKECIDAAVRCLGIESIKDLRIVHIRNTLSLESFNVSKAYLEEIKNNDHIEIIKSWSSIEFDESGNMISLKNEIHGNMESIRKISKIDKEF